MVLAGVQDRLAPLQSWLFPRRVFLQLEDLALTALVLNGRRLRWLERVVLPEGLCRDGIPQEPEALGDFVGDWLVERGFAGARVRAVLPRAATAWRVIEWPDAEWPENPEQELMKDAEALQLPWRLDDPADGSDVRFTALAGVSPRSLMVATRRSVLEGWIEVLSQSGVALDALEPWQVCVWRGVPQLEHADAPTGLRLMLELGARQSWLLAIHNGEPFGEWPMPAAHEGSRLIDALDQWRREGPWSALVADAQVLWLVSVDGLQAQIEPVSALLRQCLAWKPCHLDPLALGWWIKPDGMASGTESELDLAGLWGLAAGEHLS